MAKRLQVRQCDLDAAASAAARFKRDLGLSPRRVTISPTAGIVLDFGDAPRSRTAEDDLDDELAVFEAANGHG
jgi:hypothetical protein